MSKQKLSTVVAIALTAILASVSQAKQPSGGVAKPFKVTGGGTADHIPSFPGDESTHWAEGQATELGEYYGDGIVRLDGFTSETSGNFSSAEPFVFRAANGDELAFDYAGVVELIPTDEAGIFTTQWTATFTPVLAQCTGRFAKVTGGSFVMVAVTDPFAFGDHNVGYTWSGDGALTFDE